MGPKIIFLALSENNKAGKNPTLLITLRTPCAQWNMVVVAPFWKLKIYIKIQTNIFYKNIYNRILNMLDICVIKPI